MNDEITETNVELDVTSALPDEGNDDLYPLRTGEATQPEAEVFIGEDPSDHVAE